MKKLILYIMVVVMFSSCATVLGGRRTLRPTGDEPKRKVRWGYVVCDVIFFPPGLIVDFATGCIYRSGTN